VKFCQYDESTYHDVPLNLKVEYESRKLLEIEKIIILNQIIKSWKMDHGNSIGLNLAVCQLQI
jgi:hypothetical protein